MINHKHYLQVDLLKGLAIIFVIVGHTISFTSIKSLNLISFIFILTIFQAVPIFFLLMGRNMASSFKKRGYKNLNQIFTKTYFKRRLRRIVYPLIIAFIISAVIGVFCQKTLYFGLFNLIGQLPLFGPGNYFISIILEFIIIFPLIYVMFEHYPNLTLISCFLINLVFELISKQYILSPDGFYLYGASILRYLFLICLGLCLIKFDFNKSLFQNRLIILGFVLSMAYLFISFFLGGISQYFIPTYQYTNVMASFYPLILVILCLRYFPSKSSAIPINLLALIGKASYHIFLVQIIFFGIGLSLLENRIFINPTSLLNYLNQSNYINAFLIIFIAILINLSLCITFGLMFYYFTEKLNLMHTKK